MDPGENQILLFWLRKTAKTWLLTRYCYARRSVSHSGIIRDTSHTRWESTQRQLDNVQRVRDFGVLNAKWNDFIKLHHWRLRERYRKGGRNIIKARGNGWLHGTRVLNTQRIPAGLIDARTQRHWGSMRKTSVRLKLGRFPAQSRALRHRFQPLFVIAAFWQTESQFSLMEYTGYYLPYSRVGPMTRSRSSWLKQNELHFLFVLAVEGGLDIF